MRLELTTTSIPDVKVLRHREFADTRGAFAETYSKRDFAQAGLSQEFVQDNQSLSAKRGTIRGLHFQTPPMAQAKLVRVLRGAVLDVVVDLRPASPTYGRHVSELLSAANCTQLLVPEGFAHGFCTLEDDTLVQYKVTNFYSPEHEGGIRWDDPTLAIDWGVEFGLVVLSERDQRHPFFADLPLFFDAGPFGQEQLSTSLT